MKPAKRFIAALLCISLTSVCVDEKKDAEGFKPLFDGKTLEGWHNPYKWGKAEVVDGEIYKFRNLRIKQLD